MPGKYFQYEKNVANGVAGLDASAKFAGLLNTDAAAIKLTTQTDRSATYGTGIVYENTGTTPIHVTFSAYKNDAVLSIVAFCDQNADPTTQVAADTAEVNHAGSISFVVLPNYKYKITFGAVSAKQWFEWS